MQSLKFNAVRPYQLSSLGRGKIDSIERKEIMKIGNRRLNRLDYFAVFNKYNLIFS
jgi:hypothetical protein